MGGRISFSGLSSGIDFQSIIDTVINFESRRIDLVRNNQSEATAQLAAIQSIEAFLVNLSTQAGVLADPGDFDVRQATSSNPTVVSATLTGNAPMTTQSIVVNALAQAAQVASQGMATVDTVIGTGTVQLSAGGTATTITIDSTNNTLEGLRDAINDANAGATATIINDGSGTNPYRLLVSGTATGVANDLNITVSLTGGTQTPNFTDKLIDSAEASVNNNAAYTGLAQSGGTYTGSGNKTFLVEMMTSGAVGVATFRYSTDGGVTFDDNGGAGFTTATTPVALADGVTISFTDSGTLTTADRFTVDVFDPQIQVAQDASVTLGSTGGGGAPITISSASNTITNLIPGVTLTLNDVSATAVQISVTADNDAVLGAITNFVNSYNQILDTLDQQLDFDEATETGGLLIGDSLLVSIQNRIRRIMTGTVPGLPSDMNRLSAIGITTNIETGRLVIDSGELQSAINGDLDAVAAIFSTSFTSTSSRVNIVSSTANTVAGTGVEVDITQAATQGRLDGTSIAGFPLTLTAANNELVLIVDGQESGTITLDARTYNTIEELALEIETKANADATLGSRDVSVSASGTALTITSRAYGSSSEVRLGTQTANSATTALGLASGTAIAGVDVAGTLNGEAATGRGQLLTGNSGNATTDGLAVLVTLTAAQLDPGGPEATVTVTEGLARDLRDEITQLTDPVNGRMTRREDALNRVMQDLAATIGKQELRLEERRQDLLEEFARLEASLSSLNAQGELLTQQLANLPRIDTITGRRNRN